MIIKCNSTSLSTIVLNNREYMASLTLKTTVQKTFLKYWPYVYLIGMKIA